MRQRQKLEGWVVRVVDRRVQVVVPKGAPPKSPDQREVERRQGVKWVCCVK